MPIPDPFVCRFCHGVNTHYLICKTLRLKPGWAFRSNEGENR